MEQHVNKNEGASESEIVQFCYDAFLGDGDFEEIQSRIWWNFDAATKTVSSENKRMPSSVKPFAPFTKKVKLPM